MADTPLCHCRRCGQEGQRLDAEEHRMHARAQALEQVLLGASLTAASGAAPESPEAGLEEFTAAGRRLVGDIFMQLETIDDHRATLLSLGTVRFDVAALELFASDSAPLGLDPDSDSNIAYFRHQQALTRLRRTVDRLDSTDPYLRTSIDKLKAEVQDALDRHAGLENEAVVLKSDQRTRYLADGMDARIVPTRKHFPPISNPLNPTNRPLESPTSCNSDSAVYVNRVHFVHASSRELVRRPGRQQNPALSTNTCFPSPAAVSHSLVVVGSLCAN